VRHCLREKGLPYESRYVELWRYENLSPSYLKLNPNGVVPTLVHDGKVIINSACINEYIEDAFPDPPLRPADLLDRARMRRWVWTADDSSDGRALGAQPAAQVGRRGNVAGRCRAGA
jgi:glutathione S-transferase